MSIRLPLKAVLSYDQVDAFAYLGLILDKMVEAPTIKEQEEEIYQDDLQSSGFFEIGRNATTGY